MAEEKFWDNKDFESDSKNSNLFNGQPLNNNFSGSEVYIRQNGEDLYDSASIQSCKKEQNRDIIDNSRLGSYDKFGNYIIIPEIKYELINMPKLVVKTKIKPEYELFELISGIPLFNNLYFKLIITQKDVTLFLVENVSREAGEYVEVYEEIIDNFPINKNEISTSVILKSYHIFIDEDDYKEFKRHNSDVINILTRKVYLTLLSREINKKTIYDEKFAFNYMIDLLKESGEYGQRILNDFSTRINDRQKIFDISNPNEYYKAVNEVLLSSIDFVTTKEDKQNPKTYEIYRNLMDARNVNIDKYINESSKDIDREFVSKVVTKAIDKDYEKDKSIKEEEQEDVILEFNDILSKKSNKKVAKKLEKPILKQSLNKQKSEEDKSKEQDKDKKQDDAQAKKDGEVKKVTPAKVSVNSNKKTVVKKKASSKSQTNKSSNKSAKNDGKKKDEKKEKKEDKKEKKDDKKKDDKKDKKEEKEDKKKKKINGNKTKEENALNEEKLSLGELIKFMFAGGVARSVIDNKSKNETAQAPVNIPRKEPPIYEQPNKKKDFNPLNNIILPTKEKSSSNGIGVDKVENKTNENPLKKNQISEQFSKQAEKKTSATPTSQLVIVDTEFSEEETTIKTNMEIEGETLGR